MAERGRNQGMKERQEEETARTERRHFARRHPGSWGQDEMRVQIVIDRCRAAIEALEGIEGAAYAEGLAEVVPPSQADAVKTAFENLDGIEIHLPEIIAWSVGYEAGEGWPRSTFVACQNEEQAIALAAAYTKKVGRQKFDVKQCACRILDMVEPGYSADDVLGEG